MQFRLLKNYSKVGPSPKSFQFFSFFYIIAAFFSVMTHAQIEVDGQPPYDRYGDAVYYAYCENKSTKDTATCNDELFDNSGAQTGKGFIDDQDTAFPYRFIDTRGSNTSADLNSDLVTLSVYIDPNQAVSSNKVLVIQLFAKTKDSEEEYPIIPIRAAELDAVPTTALPDDCTAICQDAYDGFSLSTFRAAQVVPGTYLRIGFLMSDLCTVAQGVGIGQGCDDDTPEAPSNTSVVQQKVYVVLGEVDDGASFATRSEGIVESDLEFRFHQKASELSCASPGTMYFPQDGAIQLQNASFSNQVDSNASLAPELKNFFVLASLSSVNTTYSTYRSNTIVQRANGVFPSITGFTNTSTGADNQYEITILTQSYSGVVSTTSTCSVTNATTSRVLGIVSESQCFLATGAYQELNNPSLTLLRQFRDRILKKSRIGRWWVNEYYQWGPPAAKWLVHHPVFRLPVLLFLGVIHLFLLAFMNHFLLTVGSFSALSLLGWSFFQRWRVNR